MLGSPPTGDGPVVGPAPGSRALRFGLVSVAIGVLLIGFGLNGGWDFVGALIWADEHPVPGAFEEELKADTTYLISIRTSTSQNVGPISTTRTRTIAVQRLVVSDSTGRAIAARPNRGQSINRNGTGYSGVAVFDTDEGGRYRIELDTSAPTTALVTRSLTDLRARDVAWIAATVIGALLLLGGSVSSVVGFVRRRASRRAPLGSPPMPPPPRRPGTT